MQDGPSIQFSCYPCQHHKVERHVDSEADEEYFECRCLLTHDSVSGGRTPKSCPRSEAAVKRFKGETP